MASERPDHGGLSLSSPGCVKVLDERGRVLPFNADGLRLMEIDDIASARGAFWPDLWRSRRGAW